MDHDHPPFDIDTIDATNARHIIIQFLEAETKIFRCRAEYRGRRGGEKEDCPRDSNRDPMPVYLVICGSSASARRKHGLRRVNFVEFTLPRRDKGGGIVVNSKRRSPVT